MCLKYVFVLFVDIDIGLCPIYIYVLFMCSLYIWLLFYFFIYVRFMSLSYLCLCPTYIFVLSMTLSLISPYPFYVYVLSISFKDLSFLDNHDFVIFTSFRYLRLCNCFHVELDILFWFIHFKFYHHFIKTVFFDFDIFDLLKRRPWLLIALWPITHELYNYNDRGKISPYPKI